VKDGPHDDNITDLVERIKQAVKAARADGTVSMSKGNLKQLINTRGLSFANPNHFERSFEEALGRAGVGKFVHDGRAKDALPAPTALELKARKVLLAAFGSDRDSKEEAIDQAYFFAIGQLSNVSVAAEKALKAAGLWKNKAKDDTFIPAEVPMTDCVYSPTF
jgi:hypothetical protein